MDSETLECDEYVPFSALDKGHLQYNVSRRVKWVSSLCPNGGHIPNTVWPGRVTVPSEVGPVCLIRSYVIKTI